MLLPILYFSDKCPDTTPFKNGLAARDIEYSEVNITDSMANLKQFLALRDQRLEFEARKQRGFIGIPVLLSPDGRLCFDLAEVDALN